MTTRKVALYIRVSSEEQKREGISLEAQEAKLKLFVESKEWEVFQIYKDEGISAKSISIRPACKQMLEDARAHKFDAIIMVKLDRAFRNTLDAIMTSDELRELEIDLISLHETIDTTTAMGRFYFTIMSGLAQLERELTAERVDEVREHKFNQGLMIGRAPVGYKWSKTQKKFLIDEKKADMVKQVFQKTFDGVRGKLICDEFKLDPKSYYRIIRNKAYIGITIYKGVEKEGAHEPLISKEVFYEIQKREIENRQKAQSA